ncbi:hypothetical protein ONS96_014441 [Cadophora gregata f. sp. sojae]|nr:hypothetical protein ONS96_014441 [Cadophora gregata f. sp. sojae]
MDPGRNENQIIVDGSFSACGQKRIILEVSFLQAFNDACHRVETAFRRYPHLARAYVIDIGYQSPTLMVREYRRLPSSDATTPRLEHFTINIGHDVRLTGLSFSLADVVPAAERADYPLLANSWHHIFCMPFKGFFPELSNRWQDHWRRVARVQGNGHHDQEFPSSADLPGDVPTCFILPEVSPTVWHYSRWFKLSN